MKIVTQTQDEMVLKDSNVSILVVGAILIVLGGYFFYDTYVKVGLTIFTWVSLAVLLGGVIAILLYTTIVLQIDKAQGKIAFFKKRLIGSRAQTYSTQDALRVELRTAYRMESSGVAQNGAMPMSHEVLTHLSVIVFKDGTQLPIENVKSSSNVLMGVSGKEVSIANQVASFLSVPFQEAGPPSVASVLGMGSGGINPFH